MKVSIVDLRYRTNEVLKALERSEEVSVLYHGKLKGVIKSAARSSLGKVTDHPFFNMKKTKRSVDKEMARLRRSRYRDL
jgi:antitoxin (DNA-binding transcriptional repressor) of toxin-antitoxin stability system